jgi:hypothetical protein
LERVLHFSKKKIKQDWSLLFCDEHGWDEKIESVAQMEQKFGRHASKLRTYLEGNALPTTHER